MKAKEVSSHRAAALATPFSWFSNAIPAIVSDFPRQVTLTNHLAFEFWTLFPDGLPAEEISLLRHFKMIKRERDRETVLRLVQLAPKI
jgi:hypothetical protein